MKNWIWKETQEELKAHLATILAKRGYEVIEDDKYIFATENEQAKVMLVSHLDTVHKHTPDIICTSGNGDIIMSPHGIGGDDRCGVYIILQLLKMLPFKPDILFTTDEEIGGVGASGFIDDFPEPISPINYMVEFDRRGNEDCVFYDCDNREFVDFVESFGFKEEYGSYSDIATIGPQWGVASVNLSSGYYNAHTTSEYVVKSDMESIIKRAYNMLVAPSERFEHVPFKSALTTWTKYTDDTYESATGFQQISVTAYLQSYSYPIDKLVTCSTCEVEDFIYNKCTLGYNCLVSVGDYYIKVDAAEYVQELDMNPFYSVLT